jgi:hypothetical protein
VDWHGIYAWLSHLDWLAVVTGLVAAGTFGLAFATWRGTTAIRRQSDLMWHSAIPYVIPESVDGLGETGNETGRLRISYAAGNIPARDVQAWVGFSYFVWVGRDDLLTVTGNAQQDIVLVRGPSREPPEGWNMWLVSPRQGVTYRVVMRWLGPGDHVTTRAWRMSQNRWQEVPERLRG